MRRLGRLTVCLAGVALGCHGGQRLATTCDLKPGEGRQALMADYVANAPDVLFVEIEPATGGGRKLRPGDELFVNLRGDTQAQAASDALVIGQDGKITLPALEPGKKTFFEPVAVGGTTLRVARERVLAEVKRNYPKAEVQLQAPGMRSLSGQFLVRPDGKLKIGAHGTVQAAGRTLTQIEADIKALLGADNDTKVAVDVAAYNSMVYYVIADGGGFGDQALKLPITGQDTVLDAVSEIGGLPQFGAKASMWISRPVRGQGDRAEILPINWTGITKRGEQSTNYQLLAGDRLYIKADQSTATETFLAKLTAPLERILNTITLFGVARQSSSNQLGGAGGS